MDDIKIEKEHKINLIAWHHEHHKKKWHLGSTFNRFPDQDELNKLGMNAIAEGWLPSKPFITPETRVHAIGSCFARYFILWLAEHGFNQSCSESPYNALLRFGADFESVAVVAQQFRWAFGELEDKSPLWIDKQRQIFEVTDEKRQLVRTTLLNTDVLIVTLGLSEVWYDKTNNEPLWRALTEDQFDPEKHVLRIETMQGTLHWLETIERIRAKHLPHLKIIFTISPVRLSGTFRPVSPYSANNASKAILRAAVDEFLRNHTTEFNHFLYYFPSYEFAIDYFLNAFERDGRHISSTVASSIIRFFVKSYCTAEMIKRSGESLISLDGTEHLEQFILQSHNEAVEDRSGEMLIRISQLQEKVNKLQKICDERLEVINVLDQAAKDRLSVIKNLKEKKGILNRILKEGKNKLINLIK